MDRVIVFDTTLRDGEQAPGFSMNTMEKLEMAPAAGLAPGRRHRGRLPDLVGRGLRGHPRGGPPGRHSGHRAYLSAVNRFAQSSSQRMKEVGP